MIALFKFVVILKIEVSTSFKSKVKKLETIILHIQKEVCAGYFLILKRMFDAYTVRNLNMHQKFFQHCRLR